MSCDDRNGTWDKDERGFGILDVDKLLDVTLPADTRSLFNEMESEGLITPNEKAMLLKELEACEKAELEAHQS